ncbi:MAG TPA: hypothetical protein VKA84_06785 [Gemmatimonadaceae bacterium]|nr:hypothetical protein [Gemmatimonadaceae bacterium]
MTRASCLTTAALLAVAAGAAGAQAGASPLWGALRPGPHAVGFKIVKGYDYTRTARAKAGPADTAERAMPSVVGVWYPARAGARGAAMTYGAYQDAGAYQVGQLAEPTEAQRRTADRDLKSFFERPFNFPFGAVPEERWQRLRATATVAVRDAAPAAGRFPLVFGTGQPLTHAVQGEYLASHGYVVAMALPMGGGGAGAAGTEGLVRDQEYLLAAMRREPNVDRNRLGVMGFSYAGFPAFTHAMRSPDVDAVVLLESAVFSPQYAANLKPSPFYDVARLRAPLLYAARASIRRDLDRPEPFDSLRYSRRIVWQVNDTSVVHQDFGTHGSASAAVLQMRGAARDPAMRTFETVTEEVRRFFDAYVKRDPAALAALDRAPEELGVPRGLVTVERRDPVRPAPAPQELVAIVTERGIGAALRAYEDARREDPAAELFREPTLNQMGYRLLGAGRTKDAIEIFKLAVAAYPSSANAHDSLAEAYEADGNAALAIEHAERTLRAISAPGAGPNDGLANVANQRLRRLRGGGNP